MNSPYGLGDGQHRNGGRPSYRGGGGGVLDGRSCWISIGGVDCLPDFIGSHVESKMEEAVSRRS